MHGQAVGSILPLLVQKDQHVRGPGNPGYAQKY